MTNWLNQIFFRVFPGQCIVCKAATNRALDLCSGCQRDLPVIPNACWQCGLEVAKGMDTCRTCQLAPPVYSHCYGLFHYKPPINILLNQFKNQNRLAVGRVFAQLLTHAYIKQHIHFPDFWLPVPLHKSVLGQRGFNQALELTTVLAEGTNTPILTQGIHRIRKTESQKTLNSRDRVSNMAGAFRTDVDLSNLEIGIVDDVMTTGATVTSLSQSLLDAGAVSVQIVCIARTPAN